MIETEEVKHEDAEEDLIPADQLPTDPVELAKATEPTEEAESSEQESQTSSETPESSPSNEEPEEATPTEPEAPKQPAPVEGETIKERALRLELTKVKKRLREKEIRQMVGDAPNDAAPKSEVSDRLNKLREHYSEEEIALSGELIDVLAEQRGYVKAEQANQSTVNAITDAFLDQHPEYKPEHDKDDERWGKFKEILDYKIKYPDEYGNVLTLSGKTPKQLSAIFSKIHEEVREELGEAEIESKPRQLAAQQQKVKSISHTGATKSAPQKKQIDLTRPIGGVQFKGFDEEDFA